MQRKTGRILSTMFLAFILVLVTSGPGVVMGLAGKEMPPPTPKPKSLDPAKGERVNAVLAPSAPTLTGGPDQYGYTWDDSLPIGWKDATGGTQVTFPPYYSPSADDAVSFPIPIPAGLSPFKFYENEFTQVYVSSNGLLGFDPSVGGAGACLENLPIPLDYEIPQNVVAAFWDDLVVGGGEFNNGSIYYTSGTDAKGDYFAVEWHEVSKYASTDLLTFEIVFYDDGDILVQYLDLNGDLTSATAGIEDGEGIDGLQYNYNGTGQPLSSGKTILFSRPGAAYRTKAFPHAQGGFNVGGWSEFQFFVRNTGEQGPDTYNISASSGAPGWEVQLYSAASGALLADTTPGSGDGLPDTGPLAQGETFSVTVKVEAPASAFIGDETTISMSVYSDTAPPQTQDLEARTVVPSPFALTFREGQNVQVELISQYNQYLSLSHDEYRGSSFIMNNAAQANYFSLWEHNEQNTLFTNLYYTLVNSAGLLLYEQPKKLTDNSLPNYDIRDGLPVMVTAPSGNIGVAWRREQISYDPGDPQKFGLVNRNIFFAILNPSGDSFVLPETNVTNDNNWYGLAAPEAPRYENLNIAAQIDADNPPFSNEYFHITWVKKFISPSSFDIAHAVYRASDGFNQQPAQLLTSGLSGDGMDYYEPTLMAYQNQFGLLRLLLFYFFQDSTGGGDPVTWLVYRILLPAGGTEVGETSLNQGSGFGADAVQMSDGRIVVGWTDTALESDRIAFVVLRQNLASPPPPSYMTNPDGRPAGFVSISLSGEGYAALTWMDSKWFKRLYYALVDASGELVSPLTFLYSSLGEISGIETHDGLGNALYDPWWRTSLPVVSRP